MDNTNTRITGSTSTISRTNRSNPSKRSHTTTTSTSSSTIQPSTFLLASSTTVTSPSLPPSSPLPLTTANDADYISAVGLCGVNGYEAEVNHTIGLSRGARTDHHLLLTVAKVKTHSYIKRKKNRLMYACLTGNARWFHALFSMTGKTDIVSLRTPRNGTLYHLVCTLPVKKDKRAKSNNKIPKRIQILNTLLTTNIDMNVKMNTTKKQIAFDLVTSDANILYSDYRQQLLLWWLDHIDRLDPEHHNRCLPWLAYDNRLEEVQRLCRMENTDLNIKTSNGYTPLILAASKGHTSIVEELLRYYPQRLTNLNHQGKDDRTAVFWACAGDNLDSLRSLCSHPDVDLNMADEDGNTALTIAAQEGHTSIVDTLLTYYPHRLTNLNHQIESNSDWVESYLRKEQLAKYWEPFEPPRSLRGDGLTALQLASKYNRIGVVKSLCRVPDMELNKTGERGETALMIAAREGHTSIIEELLRYYPHRLSANDINFSDESSYFSTALHCATIYNHLDIVKMLCLIPEVDLNPVDEEGDTPLMTAVFNSNEAIVEELLRYYPGRLTADHLNHRNEFGETALYKACRMNHLDIVTILCRNPGIDLNLSIPHETTPSFIYTKYKIENKFKGATPLIIATEKGKIAMVNVLLEYVPDRVNINQPNKNGQTALSIALRKGHTRIIAALRDHGATIEESSTEDSEE